MHGWPLVAVLCACGRIGFGPSGGDDEPIEACDAAAPEVCNGFDDNCDLSIDEGCACTEQLIELGGDLARAPHVAWSGSGYGIVFDELSGGSAPGTYFSYIDADGARPRIKLPTANQPTAAGIAWTGQRFIVVWSDVVSTMTRLVFYAVRPDGSADDPPRVLAMPGYHVTFERSAEGFVVIHYATGRPTMLTVIDHRGTTLRETPITTATVAPRIAVTSDQIAWLGVADTLNPSQLYLQRYNIDGAELGAAVPIGMGGATSQGHDVAWTGSEYAIIWIERVGASEYMYQQIIDASGATATTAVALDTAGSNALGHGDLIWANNEFVASWESFSSVDSRFHTVVSWFDRAGVRRAPDRSWVGSGLEIVPHTRLAVASGRVGVAWTELWSSFDGTAYVRFAQTCY